MSAPAVPLTIRELSKSFGGRKALDGVSLDLSPGETLGLLGPNGAGKTTLVRSVAGRVIPDGGELRSWAFHRRRMPRGPSAAGSRRRSRSIPC